MNVSPERKIAGVLTPLFALRGEHDLGIGDVDALKQFIDWAAGVGFKLVQLLPINEVGGDNSPYNAISAMALEPTTLFLAPGSPQDLTEAAYNRITSDVNLERIRKGAVNYTVVRKLKRDLLAAAFTEFEERLAQDTSYGQLFQDFCEAESMWLDSYVFFRALMEANGDSEVWDQWREEHRTFEAAQRWLESLPETERSAFAQRRRFFRFVQWIAHGQWYALKRYAEERDLALMGDIPFGVSYYSADVWAWPERFHLQWSAGAPPEPYFKDDEFTQKWGQNWGIPLYNWQRMRELDFRWWRQRVKGVGNSFHIFRIDHVLGFYRIYAFPWRPARNREFLPLNWNEMLERTGGHGPHFAPRNDETWENCEANRREGEEYLRVVLDAAGETRLVGEDLGTVPPYVRPSLQQLGIAGFKVPQWETHQDGRIISGTEYQPLSVVTYATHDHKPIRALWQEAFEKETATTNQAREDLQKIGAFARVPVSGEVDFDRDFYPGMVRALFASESWLAVLMITDLLARKERFNVPGTATTSNWTRRVNLTVSRLRESRSVQARTRLIQRLLNETGRL